MALANRSSLDHDHDDLQPGNPYQSERFDDWNTTMCNYKSIFLAFCLIFWIGSLQQGSADNDVDEPKDDIRRRIPLKNALDEGLGGTDEPSVKPRIPDQRVGAAMDDDVQLLDAVMDGSESKPPESRTTKLGWASTSTQPDDKTHEGEEIKTEEVREEPKRPWGLDDPADPDEVDDNHANNNSIASEPTPGIKDANKRMWGTAPGDNSTKPKAETSVPHTTDAPKVPFTKTFRKDPPSHLPPDGFKIKARVYIDPSDKLAHLSTDLPHIPYWDCGVTGSTTSPLPLKNAYFRHALSGSTYWAGTDGQHAVLMVAMKGCIVELNSGETVSMEPGECVLLEDVMKPGHRVKPLEHGEISVLFLTLPETYYHVGKEHLSLPNSFVAPKASRDPCPIDPSTTPELATQSDHLDPSLLPSAWTVKRIRRFCLAIFGLSVSTLAADFLGKTAPLWLAVGIGGTSFVTAVTWAIVAGGDSLLSYLDFLFEQRKLQSSSAESYELPDAPEMVTADS